MADLRHPLLGASAASGQRAASGAARVLGLAAAPTFAAMAFWSATGNQPAAVCLGVPDGLSLDGMSLMYLLMGIFHLAPWLRLLARP